jgi:hypothetical protein
MTNGAQKLGDARSWDVSLGDLDGDGDLDAFVANEQQGGSSSAVWLNDGQGIFENSEQNLSAGMGAELGDLDGDGDVDIFIVHWNGPSKVWLNMGGVQGELPGIFADSGQKLGGGGGMDIALGDLDGDTDIDAFVANQGANTVWINDGTGRFTDTNQNLGEASSARVGLGDLDSDGDLDALTIGWGEPDKVWLNDGTGTFTDSGQTLTSAYIHIHGIALGDLDGDGDLDALLTGAPNQIWLNNGGASFYDSGQRLGSLAGESGALGDIDGDGDLDAFLATGDWESSDDMVWLNDGEGQFTNSDLVFSNLFSSDVELGDLDGDGDLDAFVTHGDMRLESGGGLPNEVWLNIIPSTTTEPTATPFG